MVRATFLFIGVIAGAVAGILFGGNGSARASNLQTTPVSYCGAGIQMAGYLAYDADRKHPQPGILVVHEWWGHNEYVRQRARKLAEMGYVALAVDMYGDGRKAQHPDQAGQFAQALLEELDTARQRFEAALQELRNHPATDPARIVAIGYCFGGDVVLHMARAGLDLTGVISFHGSLATTAPVRPGAVTARVIVFHGADDPLVPPEQIDAFRKEMSDALADYTLVIYPGATHSFTNPAADTYARKYNLPAAYNPVADEQSWDALTHFLKEMFSTLFF